MSKHSLLPLLAFLIGLSPVRASYAPIVFDNISGIDTSQIFIQFLGGSLVDGYYFDITGSQQQLQSNTAYSLAEITSPVSVKPGTVGTDVPAIMVQAFSGRVYVNFGFQGLTGMGAPGGSYTPAANDPTDPNYNVRYQYFEPTMSGGTLTADLSYIDFTSIGLSMTGVGATGSNLNQTSQNTQALVNATASVALTPNLSVLPGAAFVLPNSEFSRVISPQYEIAVTEGGKPEQVYQQWESYLGSLNGVNNLKIGGLFVGVNQQPGSSIYTQEQSYDYLATFSGSDGVTGTVTLVAQPDSGNGAWGPIPDGNQGTGIGDVVTITIQYKDLNQVTGIYGNNVPFTYKIGTAPAVTTTGINNDIFGRIVGDLLAGLSLGFVGSTVAAPGGTPIGQQYSSEWWGGGPDQLQYVPDSTSPTGYKAVYYDTTAAKHNLYFRFAQPSHTAQNAKYYHPYADALMGPDFTNPLTTGYGFPLGDRLGSNLLSIDFTQPANANAYVNLTINSDSGTAIPTFIWDGGAGTGAWQTAGNWNPGSVPTTNATVQFAGSQQTAVNTGADQTVAGLFFNYGASAFTISNNTITLSGNLVNSSSNLQTINSNLIFTADATVATVSANLTLGGSTMAIGANTIEFFPFSTGSSGQNPFVITVAGDISGVGGSLQKSGSGTLNLQGNNTFTGGVNLLAGTLGLQQSTSAGTGLLTLSGGALQAITTPLTLANSVNLGGSVVVTGTNAFTFSGPFTLTNTSKLTHSANVTLNGLLSATGTGAATYTFTKAGTGTLTLGGTVANSFAGPLAIAEGALVMSNSAGPAYAGTSVQVGDGLGTANSASLQLAAANQLLTGSVVNLTLQSDGQLQLGAFDASLVTLLTYGGGITGTGTLTFPGLIPNPTPTLPPLKASTITFQGAGNTSTVFQNDFSLQGNATAFNVFDNNAAVQLTVNGNLTGTGSLAKNNSGTLLLTGSANTLSGGVTVSSGILATSSFANSTVTLSGGGLSPGPVGTVASITLGALNLSAASNFIMDLGAGTSSDQIAITGAVNFSLTQNFAFNDAGFVAGTAANTPVVFTLATGTNVANFTLASLTFSSLNIQGLVGEFSNPSGTALLFTAQHGVSTTWSGATSGAWGTNTNWVGNAVPQSGADLVFATSPNTTIALGQTRQTGFLTFNSGGDAFTFSGFSFVLGGNIINNSSSLQTFQSGISLNGDRSILANAGDILISGAISLSTTQSSNTLTVGGAEDITISGNITDPTNGPGSLTKVGAGTLTLTGTNTFQGTLTMQGGTVLVNNSAALGNNSGTGQNSTFAFDGGTLKLGGSVATSLVQNITMLQTGIIDTNGNSFEVKSTITGPGGLTKLGAGLMTLDSSTSTSTYAGPISVQAGTLALSAVGSFGTSTSVTVANGATLSLGSNMTIQGINFSLAGSGVSNAGAISVGSGVISISGPMSLTGNAAISTAAGATLDLYSNIASAGNTLTLEAGGAGVQSVIYYGVLSGTGGLTKTGTGILNLAGEQTFSGPISINAGTLLVTNPSVLRAATGALTVLSGATLNLNSVLQTASQAPLNLSNAITLSGPGFGTPANGAIYNTLGTNTISGSVTLAASSTILSTQGTLTLAGPVHLGANTLTLNLLATSNPMTISGIIDGSGELKLSGLNQLTLSGANSGFTGSISMTGGTLIAANSAALGTSAVTIPNNATLGLQGGIALAPTSLSLTGAGANTQGVLRNFSGNNSLTGTVTVSSAPTFQVDSGTLTINSALNLNNAPLQINLLSPTSRLVFNGALTVSTGSGVTMGTSGGIQSGTVVLGTANPDFTQTITINTGTLETQNVNALQFGTFTLNTGGTFSPGGEGTIVTDNVNQAIPNGGTIIFDLGSGNSSDTIAMSSGAPVFNSNMTFFFNDAGFADGTFTLFTSPGTPVGFASIHLTSNIHNFQGTLSLNGTSLVLNATGSSGGTTFTWDGGGGNGNWTTAANWVGDVVPTTGATIQFAGVTELAVNTNANQSTGAITFQAGAGPFTVSNNVLSVNGNLTNNSTNLQTIASGLTFNNNRTITAATGAFALSGPILIDSTTITPKTLTFAGTENIAVSGIISNGATALGNLAMTGSGTLILTGVNTFAGTVTLTAGTLSANSSSALGSGASTNTLIFDGGTLLAAGNLNSPTTRGVELTETGLINPNGNTVTFGGIVAGPGGLTTSGTGFLALSGTNTYAGLTTVGTGTAVTVSNNSALGTTAAGTLVNSGGALQLSNSITLASEALTLNGTGIGGTGALRSLSGTNTYGGPITLASASTVQVDAGSLALTGAIANAGFGLSFNLAGGNATSSGGISGTGGLTIAEGGLLTLTGTNGYSGTTLLTKGTLASGNLAASAVTVQGGGFSPGGLGTIQAIQVQSLTLDGGDLFFDLGAANASDQITISGGTATLSSLTHFKFSGVNYSPGVFTLISGPGVNTFSTANLSFTSTISGFSGEFLIDGTDLKFTSIHSTGSTWDGDVSGAWGTAGNWDPTGVPTSGTALIFAGTNELTVDTQADRTTGSITFAANAGAFTIINNTLTLGGDLTNNSTNKQTINSDLTLAGDVTKTAAAGELEIGGNIALSNSTAIRTLTFSGSENSSVLGIISNGAASSGNLAMTGTGTLTLTGINTYTGTTTLTAGIVNVNSSSALGSASNTLVLNGGTLQAAANLNSPGTRNVTLSTSGTFDTQTFDVTIAGLMSGAAGFEKAGTGNLILSGANTYGGVTTVLDGILQVQNATALGSTTSGTLVAGGASLQLMGGLTIGAEALTLNGAGFGSNGALQNVSGSNTFGGGILLGTASAIHVDLGSLALTNTINLGSNLLTLDSATTLNLAGAVSGTGGLTSLGAGAVTLGGTNVYTGATTLQAGTLTLTGSLTSNVAVQSPAELIFNSASNSAYSGLLSGDGTIEKLGASTLSLTGNTTGFTGTTTLSAGTLQIGNGGSTGSLSGNIANNSALAFNRSGNVTYGGDISGTGSLSVLGTGIVTLTGTNTYNGATSITQGTLASGDLTNSAVTVNGGSFSPGGSGVIDSIMVASLTLAGGDFIFDLGTGTSDLITATSMSLTGHTVFVFNSVSFAPGTFTLLSGTGVSGFDLNLLSFNSSIAGLTGNFSKVGDDLRFIATITDNSTWDGGAGTGDWNTAQNWVSNITPGTNADITFAGTTQTNVDTQTPQTIGSLDFASGAGEFVIGTNTLTVSRDITNSSGVTQTINSNIQLTGNITKTAASGDLVFGGDISLSPNATIRTLTFDGPSNIRVDGIISNGTATSGHLVKNGTGTLTLNGANTYSGTTTVNGGILAANSSSALGNGSATNTLILNNATLLATGNINSPTTRGITLQGPVTLDSGVFNITLAGALTGSNTLSKTGTGSLILTAANTGYTGAISVQAGTLNLQNNSALGSSAAGVTVSNGAGLELQSGITIASKALTLNGFGVSGNGALRNVSGNNTYGGALTLASASEIQVDAGTLTLSTGANLGAFNLTTDVTGSLAVSGTLTGTGGVNKTGGGTLIYTNANTYTGVTTVSAGTLQIGNGGSTGSLAGSIANNAAVILNRSDSLTFANAMSGTGTFTQSGNNHVTLTGNNSFTGLTTVSGGVLQVGAGGTTGSLTGPITNGGTLIFNRSDALTYNGSISGGGSLTQTGTGTLILGGASTYTGNTVISTGAVRAANSTALGSTAGGTTVSSGAALEMANNVAIGSEALAVQGTGVGGNGAIRNISGQNSYGGAIFLDGNTTVGSDSGLLQVVNQITNNGHALTVNATGGNVGISGGLSGTGALIKNGEGSLNLSTANAYSGGTTLNAGTIAASNAGALGTGTTNLNGGALAATGTVNASTFNWAGGQIALDLAGSDLLNATDFNRVGAAPLTFTLSNASEGVFTLVTFTNQTGFNVADFAANFIGDDFFDFVFTLGANSVQLTLTANVQTGPDLNNGEGVSTTANFIVNGNVTTFGPVFANVVNSLTFMPGSVLFFDNNTVSVTSGNMTLVPGTPSLVNGSGTFFFPNGFNLLGGGALNVQIPVQVTGQTNVNANTTLYVNNTWTTSQLNILSGGALFGSGTINGNVLNNGNVNPGNSPGTLTVNGNFTQTSTGTFTLEIASATNFDRLIVNGTANLNGNLQVSVLDGYALSFGQQFSFIDAFSIEGEFSSINGLPDGFRGRLIEQGNDLVLLIAPVDYRVVAQTQNQRNVAGALNSFISATSGDRETVSIALDQLSAAAYPAAFDAIAPGYYETLTDIIVQQNNTLGQSMTQQISSARNGAPGFRTSGIELLPVESKKTKEETKDQILVASKDNRWGIWTMATGIFATATSVNNLPNYRFDTGGVIVGVDFRWNESFVTGLYAGYQYTMADYGGEGGETRINTFNFGGYATWQPTPGRGFYVDGIVGGGFSDYRVQRPIQFGSVDRSAVSKPQGGNLTSLLNVGYDWRAGGFTFGPVASAQYTYASVGGFTETGADSLNLRVNSYGANSLTSSLGGRVAYTWMVSSKVAIIPEARLLWQHEFLQNPSNIGASLDSGAGSGFDWTTAAPARDSVYAGLGATFQFGDHVNFNLYYNADFGANDYIGHSVSAGLRLKF